jgi:V8-like Glu-specific endopeptidase
MLTETKQFGWGDWPMRRVVALIYCMTLMMVLASTAEAQDKKIGRRALPFPPKTTPVDANPTGFEVRNSGGEANIDDFRVVNDICGPEITWQDVELYNGALGPEKLFVDANEPGTGQLQWLSKEDLASQFGGPKDDAGNVGGERWCSGTLIAANHFLTAAHCVEPQFSVDSGSWRTPRRGRAGNAAGNKAVPAADLAKLMHVHFKYQIDGTTRTERMPTTYRIKQLVEYGFGNANKKLDYAILEIEDATNGTKPGDLFTIIPLDFTDEGLAAATVLTIIQHPTGLPKKIAAGPKHSIDKESLLYANLDTMGGSSGSGVLSQTGRLIGVHTNGGCAELGQNRGITLKAIKSVSSFIK